MPPPSTTGDAGPGGADVLSGGPDREPRRLPRWAAPLAVGLLVGALGVSGGQQLLAERAEQPRPAASTADEVDLRAEVTGILGGEGSGTASAQVTIVSTVGPRPRGRVTGVQLVGPGLTPTDYPQPVFSVLPAGVQPEAEVDCRRAARRPLLSEADVVVTFLPASRVPREQRLPVPSEQVREAVLAACDLPDPRADLVIEASASGEAMLLYVGGVPRSKAALRVQEVRIPGFVVAGDELPVEVPPDTVALLALELRVADCAQAGSGPVVVRLTEAGQGITVVAGPAFQQPQPGAVPVEQLLVRLAERSC